MKRWWVAVLMLAVACSQAQPAASHSALPPAHTSPTVSAGAEPSSPDASPTESTGTASPSATASPPATATPPATSAPTPPNQPLLFAALEAKGTVSQFQWNTVVIAGLDGYARAKATFTPMPSPYVGCAGAVLPSSAHVAAGKVYFADGTGVIRSLSRTGTVATAATIPFTGRQQMLSFAVSPDGSKLVATVFTLPPKAATGDPCQGATAFAAGDFTLDVYSAPSGGNASKLYTATLGSNPGSSPVNPMALVGWDEMGIEALDPAVWATQGGGPSPGGEMVRVDPLTGKVLSQVDDPVQCLVWSMAASGDYACITSQGDVSVRKPDHSEVWGSKGVAPNAGFYSAVLSPNEGRVAASGSNGTSEVSWGGDNIPLGGTYAVGWADDTTVIGGGYTQDFTYVVVGPGTASKSVDIGFKGLFVGGL